MQTQFKTGSYYFEGDSLTKKVKVIFIKDEMVKYKRGNQTLYSRLINLSTGDQCFTTDKKKRVWSWNISNLHELRKNDFLKKLSIELKDRKSAQ